MKHITALIMTLAVTATAASVSLAQQQEYQQPCKCPEGYMVMWAGRVLCASQGIDQAPCPQGSHYDSDIEMCVAQPDNNRQCPEGMQMNNYRTMCLAEKQLATSACPRGGRLDKALGLCIAPCVMADTQQPQQEQ